MITDIYSRKIVGWEVHDRQSDVLSSSLVKRACLSEGVSGKDIVLHSDNGSPMKGATMLVTLQNLGVIPSFSRPSVSNDNPYSKSLFKTLKYSPIYPSKPFDTIEIAREWVLTFVRWYNSHHHHSGIKFVIPHILCNCQRVKMVRVVKYNFANFIIFFYYNIFRHESPFLKFKNINSIIFPIVDNCIKYGV